MYGHWDTRLVGDFDSHAWHGFLYTITAPTGRVYVGKKSLHFKRRRTTSNPSTRKDSDWRVYTGSCKELNADIASMGKDRFRFAIVRLCSGKSELYYEEMALQMRLDVLRARNVTGERLYYNGNIATKHFKSLEAQTDESRRRRRPSLVTSTLQV